MTILTIFAIPIISLAAGMFFGRNAPHRKEYDYVDFFYPDI